MLNQWICFLLQASPGPVIGFAMDSMLPVKKNAPPKWVRVGLWCLVILASSVYRVFFSFYSEPVNMIFWVGHFFAAIISICFFYDGSLWNKLAVNMIVLLVLSFGDFGAAAVLMLFGIPVPKLPFDYNQSSVLLGMLAANITIIIAIFVSAYLWRKYKLHKQTLRSSWIYIVMFIYLLFPTVIYCMETYHNGQPLTPFNVFSLTGSLIFSVVLICVQFNQSEKYEVEKELSALKQQYELESQYYNNVEAHREEMAKIRHDYNNLISSVIGLLQMDKTREAEETMKGLLAKVEETREYPYCGIPIVNAILSEKEEVCRKNGITLQTDLLFPEDTAITPVDLCSIFANLLDNAIRACNHLPPEKSRKIDLNVAVQGDYLLIRCDNPSLKAPGKRAEGTGYGLKILSDIGKRYGGEFRANFEDGIFTAKLILLCE